MSCATCGAPMPELARYCHRCGTDEAAAGGDARRTASFAVAPGEPVASFNLVSSIMPMASGTGAQAYRFALAGAAAVPVLAAMLGYLAFAFAAAAVVIPVAYLVYLYDVNEWEDQPIPVVLATVALAAVLGVLFTLFWRDALLGTIDVVRGRDGSAFDGERFVVLGLLVPIGAMVLSQVGPTILASRPAFDDLIDGLTFGIASGATFAAAETLVLNRNLLGGFGAIDHPDAALWAALVLSAAIVKPIVYGGAAGLAVAAFSGVGDGAGRTGPRHLRGFLESVIIVSIYLLGLEVAAVAVGGTAGAVVGLLWGLVVVAVVLLRVRFVLHVALLEAALDATARGDLPASANRGTGTCPACRMPLLDEASFCSACGSSVRATNKPERRALARQGGEAS
ncbi:MAG: zinc ribbon domain-containing protein [Acidimicrobiales bacterium]